MNAFNKRFSGKYDFKTFIRPSISLNMIHTGVATIVGWTDWLVWPVCNPTPNYLVIRSYRKLI